MFLVILRTTPEEMGSETMGVLSNFEGLHPMRDGMRNERLVDYYFGIIGRMDSK